MRNAISLALAALLLGGCASHKPEDLTGIWINQDAIDRVVASGQVTQTLNQQGIALEWQLDSAQQTAVYSNGFEADKGRLMTGQTPWHVQFQGTHREQLTLDGNALHTRSDANLEQTFVRVEDPAANKAPLGSSFERALLRKLLGGDWTIVDGPGKGSTARFAENGTITGIPGLDRYAVCLAGDCADMGGTNDSLWLERDQHGAPFIFKRSANRFEIFTVINQAQAGEKPVLAPAKRQWLLERR